MTIKALGLRLKFHYTAQLICPALTIGCFMAKDLTQGEISPLLYRLTAPMVMGIMAMFLFNLVDTYFISLLGTQPLAAVSFTFPVTMLVMNMAIGLSIATGAVVARSLGQKDHDQAKQWIGSSVYLSVVISVCIALTGIFIQEPIFKMLGASVELIPMIAAYMDWWFTGSVFLVVLIVINASIRATGNTKLPSLVMLFSAVLNGILDPLLIFGIGPFPELGIKGAAIATFIAWVMAFMVILRVLMRQDLITFQFSFHMASQWKKLLSLGIPAALTNMLGPIANGILVAWVAKYGTVAVAAYGVGSRLEPLALIVIMAFTASLPPFVGQNLGAGQHQRIEDALKKSIQFIFVWQLLVYVFLCLLASPISQLFSEDESVQKVIQIFLYIVPMSYAGLGISLVSTATLNSLHKPRISLAINALRLFVLYVPLAWIGNNWWGLTGLFWGCAIANLLLGITVMGAFQKVRNDNAWRTKLLSV